MAIFFEGSGTVSGIAGKAKARPERTDFGAGMAIARTRVMKDMPTMQIVIKRNVIIGPRNVHGDIQ
jgi:hypothetical protein